MSHNLIDDEYRVRQGENKAAVLVLIDRENGTVIKQADLNKVAYSIVKRGQPTGTSAPQPPDVPLPDHTDVEIPVAACIRDNPPIDLIDNVAYNFLFIIPAVDAEWNDITPFTEAGAIYDLMIRFFPSFGGPKYVITRTIVTVHEKMYAN